MSSWKEFFTKPTTSSYNLNGCLLCLSQELPLSTKLRKMHSSLGLVASSWIPSLFIWIHSFRSSLWVVDVQSSCILKNASLTDGSARERALCSKPVGFQQTHFLHPLPWLLPSLMLQPVPIRFSFPVHYLLWDFRISPLTSLSKMSRELASLESVLFVYPALNFLVSATVKSHFFTSGNWSLICFVYLDISNIIFFFPFPGCLLNF